MVTLPIAHFSGTGVGTTPTPFIQPLGCTDVVDMESLTSNDLLGLQTNGLTSAIRTAFTSDLKLCYRDFLEPAMSSFLNLILTATDPDSHIGYIRAFEGVEFGYLLWRLVIADVQGVAPTFTVTPEFDASKVKVASVLRTWYDEWNLNCTLVAPHDAADAVAFAAIGISAAHRDAPTWGVDTKPNRLDYETLLNDLCVQIVIDPLRGFSASKPGDEGTVSVPVGYTVGGGDVRHDQQIDVRLTLTGEANPFAEGRAPSDGPYTADLTWPDGVDPLKIDILAYFEDDSVTGVLSSIARFDRITKSQHAKIVFSARGSSSSITTSIYVMEDNGQSIDRLTFGSTNDLDPRWSPDGATIAFERNRSIYTMAADGSDVQQLTSGALDSGPAWSPDGSKIAFERRQIGSALPGPGESFIDVMNADGSNIVDTGVVAAEDAPLSWSPDGTRIAYTQLLTDGPEIREAIGLMGADGRGASTIAGSPSAGKLQGASPAWSPDGSRIAFYCFGLGIPGALCMVSPSAGSATQVVKTTCGSPTWSPDGSKIACIGDDQTIRVVDLSTGTIASLGAGGASFAGQPDWGP